MAIMSFWLRLELRRRWRSLLVLTVLVTVSAGVVLTAVAGARRAQSALDRLLTQTLPATAVVLPGVPGTDWDAVRRLPGVEAVSEFPLSSYDIDGIPREGYAAGPPQGRPAFDRIERAAVLQGRLADPDRADEVVVSPGFVKTYGLGVGDSVTLRLLDPAQASRLYEDAAGSAGIPAAATGPRIETRIVGVVRSLYFRDQPGTPGVLFPSPSLFEEYRANLIGGSIVSAALVRLTTGSAALPAFRRDMAALTGRSDTDVFDQAAEAANTQRTIDFESGSLLAAAFAAAVVATVLIGQSVTRHVTGTVDELDALRAVGMTRADVMAAAAAGPTLAAVAGAAAGCGAATLASAWFPIGTASDVEPAPGVDVDALVLVAGTLLIVVLTAAGCLAVAAARFRRVEATAARSAVSAALARLGMPVPLVMGVRHALAAARGRGTAQVRAPLLGAVVGVAGLTAALTVSAGVTDAVAEPARFGQTGRFQIVVGAAGVDFELDLAPILGAAAADQDVSAVLETRAAVVDTGGLATSAYSYEPVGGRPYPVALTTGRMASGPDEIVLGPTLASRLGLKVGDRVTVTGDRGAAPLTVTGTGFVPNGSTGQYDEGAWLSSDGYDRLATGFALHAGFVALRGGVDPSSVLPRLVATGAAAAGVANIPLLPVDDLTEIAQVRNIEVLPLALGGFLAIMATATLGHALATAVRRRRREFAVVRVLGMTRRQVRLVLLTHAATVATVGLLAGIPLGVALGRVLWRVVADLTPLQYQPPVVVVPLLLTVPVATAVVAALAVRPGIGVVRVPVADVLREEQQWA